MSEFDEGWNAALKAINEQHGESFGPHNLKKPETDGELLARLGTDAQLWAKEYVNKVYNYPEYDIEHFTMTWFANAIEAGRSEGWEEGHLWRNAAIACNCETRERERIIYLIEDRQSHTCDCDACFTAREIVDLIRGEDM